MLIDKIYLVLSIPFVRFLIEQSNSNKIGSLQLRLQILFLWKI